MLQPGQIFPTSKLVQLNVLQEIPLPLYRTSAHECLTNSLPRGQAFHQADQTQHCVHCPQIRDTSPCTFEPKTHSKLDRRPQTCNEFPQAVSQEEEMFQQWRQEYMR